MRVHMLARSDVGSGDTDVLAVLHDLLATLDVRARDLVEQRNVLASHDMALASARQRIGDIDASLELVNGDDDVVLLVDDDAVSHERSSLFLGRFAVRGDLARRLAPAFVAWVRCVLIYERRSVFANAL